MNCDAVFFSAACDEPGAVVFGFRSSRELGLRLPTRDDLSPPNERVSQDSGRYLVREVTGGAAVLLTSTA